MKATVTKISRSKLVDNQGAVDADVTIEGIEVSVTLIPNEQTGWLDSWGDLDHWLSGWPSRRIENDHKHAIIEAVREEAAKTWPLGMGYYKAE
jgi:hypothetical protein